MFHYLLFTVLSLSIAQAQESLPSLPSISQSKINHWVNLAESNLTSGFMSNAISESDKKLRMEQAYQRAYQQALVVKEKYKKKALLSVRLNNEKPFNTFKINIDQTIQPDQRLLYLGQAFQQTKIAISCEIVRDFKKENEKNEKFYYFIQCVSANFIAKYYDPQTETINGHKTTTSQCKNSFNCFSFSSLNSKSTHAVHLSLFNQVQLKTQKEKLDPLTITLDPNKKITLPGRGSLSGVVTDASTGKPLKGIKVFVPGVENQLFTYTDENGFYRLENVPTSVKKIEAKDDSNTYIGDWRVVRIKEKKDVTDQNLSLVPKSYSAGKIIIVLTWDKDPVDLDSQLYSPTHEHLFYNRKNIHGGSLDVDDTTSYGPETTSLNYQGDHLSEKGTYRFEVIQYAGKKNISTSGARVVIYRDGERAATFYPTPDLKSLSKRKKQNSPNWSVCEISSNGDIKSINSLDHDPREPGTIRPETLKLLEIQDQIEEVKDQLKRSRKDAKLKEEYKSLKKDHKKLNDYINETRIKHDL